MFLTQECINIHGDGFDYCTLYVHIEMCYNPQGYALNYQLKFFKYALKV